VAASEKSIQHVLRKVSGKSLLANVRGIFGKILLKRTNECAVLNLTASGIRLLRCC
jgi:hypothetical protein